MQTDPSLPDDAACANFAAHRAEDRLELPVGALGIGVIAREIGLTKDTLRVWERRYGFLTKRSSQSANDDMSAASINVAAMG